MPWTLDDLKLRPKQLRVPLRPVVTSVADMGSGWTMNAGGGTYEVRYFSKGGVGADGSAVASADTTASMGVTCNGGVGAGGNAYLLPWDTDRVYVSELGQKHDFFFTAKLNGCAIFISGGLCNPTVVHANAERIIPAPTSLSKAATATLLRNYQGAYAAISGALVGRGDLDPATLSVFQPGVHGYVGDAAVFGVRNASRWAFYAVIGSAMNPAVVKLWPK